MFGDPPSYWLFFAVLAILHGLAVFIYLFGVLTHLIAILALSLAVAFGIQFLWGKVVGSPPSYGLITAVLFVIIAGMDAISHLIRGERYGADY